MDLVARADDVIDLGPGAGYAGGRIVFEGPVTELAASTTSVTARYLRDR